MKFPKALIPGRLLRRYKRFLADVRLANGEQLTVHCPNTGAMLGCQSPGSRVWLSRSDNPRRKYRHTWEVVEVESGVLVGINTQLSNHLVRERIETFAPEPLSGYAVCQREVRVGEGRLDLLLRDHPSRPDCYVEVKNVTAAASKGVALFPDARSPRATRHLESLMAVKAGGARAALVFCVQREDVDCVKPACDIDPAFSKGLVAAKAAGVELFALGARVSVDGIFLERQLRIGLPL